jgi:putative endonuclease
LKTINTISRKERWQPHRGPFGKWLNAHNSGKVISTKSLKSWERIWLEQYDSRSRALKREKYLKSGWGRRWIYSNVLTNLPAH